MRLTLELIHQLLVLTYLIALELIVDDSKPFSTSVGFHTKTLSLFSQIFYCLENYLSQLLQLYLPQYYPQNKSFAYQQYLWLMTPIPEQCAIFPLTIFRRVDKHSNPEIAY